MGFVWMPRRYWLVILTYMVVQFSVFVMGPVLYAVFPIDENTAFIYWNIFSFVVGTIIVLSMMRVDFEKERLHKTSGWMIALWVFAGFWMAYFAQIASVLIEIYVLEIPVGSENTDAIVNVARAIPAFVIVPAVVGPILEELIFRKIIFGSLHKRMNFFFAAFISSVVFGALHMDFSHMLTYFTMGLVFAFLYVQTKRIWVPIVVHMAMNTFAVVGQMLIDPEEIEKMREQMFLLLPFLWLSGSPSRCEAGIFVYSFLYFKSMDPYVPSAGLRVTTYMLDVLISFKAAYWKIPSLKNSSPSSIGS